MESPIKSHIESRRDDVRLALSIKDAATASGLSRSTLYNLIDKAKLRAIKVAGRRLILIEDLKAMLNSGAQQ
jgi:excisionase family DNA binding protein